MRLRQLLNRGIVRRSLYCVFHSRRAVASPGFVARRGKAGNYVMGHSRRTSGPAAAADR